MRFPSFLCAPFCFALLTAATEPATTEPVTTLRAPTPGIQPQVVIDASGTKLPDGDLWADTWVATDGVGRTLPGYREVGPPRADKSLAIFYFLWVNRSFTNWGSSPAFDITKILASDEKNRQWGPFNAFHFWGEPELGYYTIDDPFVLNKHVNMLVAAQIDALICDNTNGPTYAEQAKALVNVLSQGRERGVQVPHVAFMHWGGAPGSVQQVYKEFYQAKIHPELWFNWLGKPLVLAPPEKMTPEIANFFTTRSSWSDHKGEWFGDGRDRWCWSDRYPQGPGWHESPDKPEEISVLIAGWPHEVFGRSFHDGKQPKEGDNHPEQGLCFAEQWKRALEVDPQLVFVTGWNEWVAQRGEWGKGWGGPFCGYMPMKQGDGFFVDQMNQEFSRDAEPMRGGHSDAYYYQLVANARRYKGVRPPPLPVASPIAILGLFEDWAKVRPDYRDFTGDTLHRDSVGWCDSLHYTNTTGRNDIVRCKVSYDSAMVYFYVETAAPITSWKDKHWMTLLIDADQDHKTGWEGYDYAVNLGPASATRSDVRANQGGGWKWSNPVAIDYRVTGNRLELGIPRAALGLRDKAVKLDFKWVDNYQAEGDISDFAINGDAAPDRRFNYRYDATLTPAVIDGWTKEAAAARKR